ncbi:MAG: hypothetical protein LBS21_05130 [Clostridiales bacterium]|jgi:hypothetical protein|nr:hypothetical protein [Clostridiales bacterium]
MKYAAQIGEFALAFEPDALGEADLEQFYYNGTMAIRMNDENESPINDIYKSCLTAKNQNAHLLLGGTEDAVKARSLTF